jgi:hypothetical protein
LTKKQQYSQIAQGNGCYRKTVWATQTESFTNSNIGIPSICPNRIICVPTSNSDVPGKKIMLCSNKREIQLYYPRIKRTMGNTNTTFPEGYKFN